MKAPLSAESVLRGLLYIGGIRAHHINRRCAMRKLIKIAVLIYILEYGGAAASRMLDRLPEREPVSGKLTDANELAEGFFRKLGFEPQNPNAS